MKLYLYAKINKDYSVSFENTDNQDIALINNIDVIDRLNNVLYSGNKEWKKFIIGQIELVNKVERILA